MTPPAVAIQIVNYDTREYLERCLASVYRDLDDAGFLYEVNLLDNASGDELGDLAGRYPGCAAETAPENLGFGGGHNLLATRTDAERLLILNPDTELVEPDTIARLLQRGRGGSGATVVGPKLLNPDGTAQRWDHGRLHGLRAQISNRGGASYWHESARGLDVAWVSGAAMLADRAAFTAVGGFDEQFFLYKEDEDLCLRLRLAGGAIAYEPSVAVRHYGSVVAGRGPALAQSEQYFIEKHFSDRRSQPLFAAVHRLLPYLRL